MEITVREAAERLKVSPGRVRQLIAAGRIAARHVTTTLLVMDERELAKPTVKTRKPGRPWPKKKGR
jgi:excisionase family DNA binding protein